MLETARVEVRAAVLQQRKRSIAAMRRGGQEQGPPLPYTTHPDDFVRVMGFMFALIKALDKLTAAAKVALSGDGLARDSWLSWLK